MTDLAIFRDHEDEIIALFPEIPGSRKPRECLAYSDSKGFHAVDYEDVMFHSRSTKAKFYRDVLHQLNEQGYAVNLIQRASPIMHDKRKRAAETYDDDNRPMPSLGLEEQSD